MLTCTQGMIYIIINTRLSHGANSELESNEGSVQRARIF